MRTEPHPLPTEPCVYLPGFGSLSKLLSNASLHRHLPPQLRPLQRLGLFPKVQMPPESPRPAFLPLPTGPLPPGLQRPRPLAPLPAHAPASYPIQWERDGKRPRVPGRSALRAGSPTPQRHGHRSCCLLLAGAASAAQTDLSGLTAAARARHCRRAASRARARARQGRGRGPRRLLVPLSRSWRPGIAAFRHRVLRGLLGSLVFLSCLWSSPGLPCPLLLPSPISRHNDNGPSNIALPLSSSAAWGHATFPVITLQLISFTFPPYLLLLQKIAHNILWFQIMQGNT